MNTVSPGFTQTPALDKGKATGTLDDATMAASTALGLTSSAMSWSIRASSAFGATLVVSGPPPSGLRLIAMSVRP